MKNLLILIALSFICASCSKDPIRVDNSNNPDIKIDYLFKHNNCSVYRFYDNGNAHYFVECENFQSIINTREKCQQVGKTRVCQTKDENIETHYK